MDKDESVDILAYSSRDVLELGEARLIYGTYLFTKDRVLVNKQCQASASWAGSDGYKRILGYVKQLDAGEIY